MYDGVLPAPRQMKETRTAVRDLTPDELRTRAGQLERDGFGASARVLYVLAGGPRQKRGLSPYRAHSAPPRTPPRA